jgi:hypothetical protein
VKRGPNYNFGGKNRHSGSDSDSWRKSNSTPRTSLGSADGKHEGERGVNEATSPLKLPATEKSSGVQKKLDFVESELEKDEAAKQKEGQVKSAMEGTQGATGGEAQKDIVQASRKEAQHGGLLRPNMHGPTKEVTSKGELGKVKKPQTASKDRSGKGSAEKVQKTTFKMVRVVTREGKTGESGFSGEGFSELVGQKRSLVEKIVEDVGGVKKWRMEVDNEVEGLGVSNNLIAGLSE